MVNSANSAVFSLKQIFAVSGSNVIDAIVFNVEFQWTTIFWRGQDKTADFKWDKTADFENERKPPISKMRQNRRF